MNEYFQNKFFKNNNFYASRDPYEDNEWELTKKLYNQTQDRKEERARKYKLYNEASGDGMYMDFREDYVPPSSSKPKKERPPASMEDVNKSKKLFFGGVLGLFTIYSA